MNHKIISYIVAHYKLGESKDKIWDSLRFSGYSVTEIDDSFDLISNKAQRNRALFWVVLLFLVLITIASLSIIYLKVSLDSNQNLSGIVFAQDIATTTFTYGEQPAIANSDYFQKVKNDMTSAKVSFLEANLSEMKMRVYQDGVLSVEVPIKTKGREGSWWETPAGIYKINSKAIKGYSSIGHVYMPYSLAFDGNFLIHGWPYYPDGTPVATQYSGGCIRMADEDAEKVYEATRVGMPVVVFENKFIKDNFDYSLKLPEVKAKGVLVADLKNNYVILEKDKDKALPIASLTKLITALVAAEHINLDKEIKVPKEALIDTSKSRLVAGQSTSVYQLLFPLLLESSNEAAEAIAMSFGRDRFIAQMNEKAKSLGMLNTVFVDPSGAESGNISTPEDLFMLAKYIYNNRSFVFNLTAGKVKDSAYGSSVFPDLGNFNDYAGVDNFVGGKTGKNTEALETSLHVFKKTINGEERPIVVIILGTENHKIESDAVLNYLNGWK